MLDSILLNIASNLKLVEFLDLSNCFKITDSAVIRTIKLLSLLKRLNLTNVLNVTDETLGGKTRFRAKKAL